MHSIRVYKYIFLLLSLFFIQEVNAQDAQFSKFLDNPTYLNPAYVGATRAHRIILNNRNQYWGGNTGGFQSWTASYDLFFSNAVGFGISALSDKQQLSNDLYKGWGVHSQSLAFTLSYEMPIAISFLDEKKDWRLRGGASFGVGQRMVDTDLYFGNGMTPDSGGTGGYDPILENFGTSLYPDFSIGMLLSTSTFATGFAMHHLNQPTDYSFTGEESGRLRTKYTIHASKKLYLGEFLGDLLLATQFKTQGSQEQLAFGVDRMFRINPQYKSTDIDLFSVGVWGRALPIPNEDRGAYNVDALILAIGYTMGREFSVIKFNASYDITVSKLGLPNTNGTVEFSISYAFKSKTSDPKEPVRWFSRNYQCEDYLEWGYRKVNHGLLIPQPDNYTNSTRKASRKGKSYLGGKKKKKKKKHSRSKRRKYKR